MNTVMCRVALLLLLVAAGNPTEARAHARSTSFSYWYESEGQLSGRLVFPWLEIEQVFPQWRGKSASTVLAIEHDAAALLAFFQQTLRVPGCALSWQPPYNLDASLIFEIGGACHAEPAKIEAGLTFDSTPSHVHLLRYEEAGRIISAVLTSSTREFDIAKDSMPAFSFAAYLSSGYQHIAAGADHLVFLVSLLLLAPSFRSLLMLVTGFTLAHSASLAIAVLGNARPHIASVEALIGFTVAFAALEILLRQAADNGDAKALRWAANVRIGYALLGIAATYLAALGVFQVNPLAMAGIVLFTVCFLFSLRQSSAWQWLLVFLFGFIHGFGFAGPLLDLALTKGQTAAALFAFNLGVEAGQVIFIGLACPVIWGLNRTLSSKFVTAGAAALILAAGLHWFLLRALV